MHAGYYAIPATKTEISQADLEKVGKENELKGGFRYAKNLRGSVYVPPRPLRGHGPHRYFYLVVALKGKLEISTFPKDELAKEIDGKVLGWGQWVGVAERK